MNAELADMIADNLAAIRASMERTQQHIRDLKFRVGQIEQTLVHHNSRFDRLEERLEHIEKRLGLVDA